MLQWTGKKIEEKFLNTIVNNFNISIAFSQFGIGFGSQNNSIILANEASVLYGDTCNFFPVTFPLHLMPQGIIDNTR